MFKYEFESVIMAASLMFASNLNCCISSNSNLVRTLVKNIPGK
jgi:hypothetical protein